MKTVYEIVSYQGVYSFEEPVRSITLHESQFATYEKVVVPFLDYFFASLLKDSTIEAYRIEGKLYVE